MINFTIQHVLILRILMQFPIVTENTLHNFLFLVSSEAQDRHPIGFYDFIRTKTRAISPTVRRILEDFYSDRLVERRTLILTEKGREAYYALATALRAYEDFNDRCLTVGYRYSSDINQVNKAVLNNFLFRKAKIGGKIF